MDFALVDRSCVPASGIFQQSAMQPLVQNLSSPRLRLREMRSEDAPTFFQLVTSDVDTVRYVQWRVQRTVAEAEALVATFLAAAAPGEKLYFVAEDGTGAPVGFASMKVSGTKAEIGFVVARARRRQGYAAELIALLTQAAFRDPLVMRVEGLCDSENVGSAAAMVKAGFLRDAVLPKHAIHPNLSSESRDLVRYVKDKTPRQAPVSDSTS